MLFCVDGDLPHPKPPIPKGSLTLLDVVGVYRLVTQKQLISPMYYYHNHSEHIKTHMKIHNYFRKMELELL